MVELVQVADLGVQLEQDVTLVGIVVELNQDWLLLDDSTGQVRVALPEPGTGYQDAAQSGQRLRVWGRAGMTAAGLVFYAYGTQRWNFK